jgi:hypothetical protein
MELTAEWRGYGIASGSPEYGLVVSFHTTGLGVDPSSGSSLCTHPTPRAATAPRACGSAGSSPHAEFHDFSPAAVIRLAIEKAAPASKRHHTPESGREVEPSGPSPDAVASHDRARGAAQVLCMWDTTLALLKPYYTHQVLELPPIAMDVTHWVLLEGWCPDSGRSIKAQVPAAQATGYGPRFSALIGEVAGTYGNGGRMVQTFCGSVLGVSISLGAIQKILDRVAPAIEPHYTVIARQARQAAVNYVLEHMFFHSPLLAACESGAGKNEITFAQVHISMKRPGSASIRCTGCG